MIPTSIPQSKIVSKESNSSSISSDDEDLEESFVILHECGEVAGVQCPKCDLANNSIAAVQTMTNSETTTIPIITMTPPPLPTTATPIKTTTPRPPTTTLPPTTPPPLTTTLPPPPPKTTTSITPPPSLTKNAENPASFVSLESNSSGASELSSDEIQHKMGNLLLEIHELKGRLILSNSVMKKQYNDVVKWHAEAEEAKNISAKLRAGEVNLKSKISTLEFELDTLRQATTQSGIDQAKIIEELGLKLSESEKSKSEESIKYKNQIDSLSSQLSHVELEYEKIKKELDDVKQKLPTEADAANIENMKEQLKEQAQELVFKNAMLKEKTDLNDYLHEIISKLESEIEAIPLLKAQVEVYLTDFNQERQERKKLKSEKDKVAEKLRCLARENLKLLEKNELLEREAFIRLVESLRSVSSDQISPAMEQSPPLTSFTCPICAHNFSNQDAAEEHIEQCI